MCRTPPTCAVCTELLIFIIPLTQFPRLCFVGGDWESISLLQPVQPFLYRYAAILFKKQKYVSGQHRVNLKIVCRENYKYEVQEKSPANQAVTMQQLAEEYWRWAGH